MFWREEDDVENEFRVPEDVFDLLFRLRGSSLDIDHAWALAATLQRRLGEELCTRIGVHGVRLADSGNGWIRPQQPDAALPLSRRSRLEIRVHRDDVDAVRQISRKTLDIGSQQVEVGDSSMRKLSAIGTLYARAVRCAPEQSEDDFLARVAQELEAMGIQVSKMICGKAGAIRAGEKTLFTRTLLVADLKPEESVILQRNGIGDDRLIGCGLFVPHKGIDAVFSLPQ